MKPFRVVIIGAGIGGLTLALALKQRGFEPVIYERAQELGEVGAGITLWPNATRVLFALGLKEKLDAISEEPVSQTIFHFQTGDRIQVHPRAQATRDLYGAPLYQIHRRDLHDMLADAVRASMPDAIRLGHELVRLERVGDRGRVHFSNGTSDEADLVVGCDGIRSCVRTGLFGHEDPRFTNIVAWRGLVPIEKVPEKLRADPAGIHIGPNCHVAHYTIRHGTLLNYLAFAKVDTWEEEGWTIPSTISQVLNRFAEFTPTITDMIAATPPDRCFKWGLFDRDVREQWSDGPFTLLGDAAHPMLPFLGQGAGMVIEDTVVLARALEASAGLPEALSRYEGARRERTGYTMLKGRAHAEYYNSHPDEADASTLEMKIDLNEYDALTVEI